MSKYTNIELIVMLIKYKNENNIKIPNIQQMKKEELLDNCKIYKLIDINEIDNGVISIALERLSKKQMIQDVEIFFLKQNKDIKDIEKFNCKKLIEIMEEYNIPHLTQKQMEKEMEENIQICTLKDIIKYNYIKYGLFDVKKYNFDEMNIEELQKFIKENKLNINIEDYEHIDNMSNQLITIYTTYCNNIKKKIDIEKRTIPYLLEKIKKITEY